mmetsp:Transcript_100884/g.289591  ORF Transcript_100884/g.289591 Transcript_100884/m.289591 type:complete len:202 (-) Transcript_100884:292-897(-)
MPTVIEFWRERKVKRGLPLLPYSSMAINGFVWVLYGWVTGTAAICLANGLSLVLAMAYCIVFISLCPPTANWLPGKIRHHGLISSVIGGLAVRWVAASPSDEAAAMLGWLGSIIAAVMFGSPVVSISTVISEKSTRVLALPFTIAVTINTFLWMSFGLLKNDPFLYCNAGCGFVTSLIQVGLFLVFGVQTEKPRDEGPHGM